jgi:hypothetical protein
MIFFDIILIVVCLAIAIGTVLYFIDSKKGCGGDCYQGRRECNCKRNKDKE